MSGLRCSSPIPHQKLAVGTLCVEAKIATEFTLWAELTASEVKEVKDFIQSKHMQDVFKKVNDISTAPIEIIWLEEVGQ